MPIQPDTIEKYKNIDWDLLLRNDLGKAGNLEQIKPNLDRIKKVLDDLLERPVLTELPNAEQQVQSVLNNFIVLCETKITNGYTDVTQQAEKIKEVRNFEQDMIQKLAPTINYIHFADPSNKAQLDELSNTLDTAKKLIEKTKREAEENKEIAKGQEVTKYGRAFGEMADENATAARNNFWLMLGSMIATVILAFAFLQGEITPPNGEESWIVTIWNTLVEQNILLKLFIISSGGYLVAHFSRNFSAEKHLYYTNKHRQNALESHDRILNAVSGTEKTENDIETQNAILIQVTRTMFEMQDTGYLKNQSNPVPSTQIIENIKPIRSSE